MISYMMPDAVPRDPSISNWVARESLLRASWTENALRQAAPPWFQRLAGLVGWEWAARYAGRQTGLETVYWHDYVLGRDVIEIHQYGRPVARMTRTIEQMVK
jgi:hypothetical protein